MKQLHELTQIGRGRRLRPAAERVLQEYGVKPSKLQQITSASNTIFRVSTTSSGDYVLRMTAPKSCHGSDEIRSEIAWLHALDRDTDIGIPTPIPRMDGLYVTDVSVPGTPESVCCALYRWVPGMMLDDARMLTNVERQGALMAQLHEHAGTFEPPTGFRIRTYDSVFPYADESFPNVESVVLIGDEAASYLTPEQRRIYHDAYRIVAEETARLMTQPESLRVIHNDLHVWNVKVTQDRIYALDFEDMMWGTPQQDIATTLYYFRWLDSFDELRAAFRAGYESVRAWPEDRAGQIEILTMGRMLLLANYVAVSEDSEDRAFAPEYLSRVGTRLAQFVASI